MMTANRGESKSLPRWRVGFVRVGSQIQVRNPPTDAGFNRQGGFALAALLVNGLLGKVVKSFCRWILTARYFA